MRQKLVLGILLFAVAAGLAATPKVAVLDAVIPESMDKSVVIPITDKIAEEFVMSKDYTVLDRVNIAEVLSEKEFQVSGIVNDSEIKKAGEYLGADFVVVARVSQVGDTYFISAKMISVETGEVIAQTSDDAEGKISVLIKVAESVGGKLVGRVIESDVVVQKEQPKPEPEPEPEPEPDDAPAVRSRVAAFFDYPVFLGSLRWAHADWADYWTGNLGLSEYGVTNVGLDLHVAHFVLPFLYISVSGGISGSLISYDLNFEECSEVMYWAMDAFAGVGAGRAITSFLQIWGGGKIGVMRTSLGEWWSDDTNWTSPWDGLGDVALAYGAEIGVDLILFKLISLSARVDFVRTTIPWDGEILSTGFATGTSAESDDPFTLNRLGLFVGAGIAYK